MDKPWDIVIVGGGLSGLALAVELCAPEFSHLSVLVLEKRTLYERDRTWSYWTQTPHRYTSLERQRWQQWEVALSDQACVHSTPQYAYASLDADAFYQAARSAIGAAPHVQLRLGEGVSALTPNGTTMGVTCESGNTLQARWLFDARPPAHVKPSGLVQQFAGWEVHTQHDVFKPDTVRLMAFEPHDQGVHFWYILPYSPRAALVESTWVSPASWQPDLQHELRQYADTLCGQGRYSIAYREQGVLALDGHVPASQPHVVALGRGGGALRPATGYAFLDILAHSRHLADSLREAIQRDAVATWQPQPFTRPAVDSWMDAVFLDALSRDWRAAPQYFMRMFERVSADHVVAFLTGKASAMQRLTVMRALPVAPFARAALRRFAARPGPQ
jgi:lycopene beta-cyclase